MNMGECDESEMKVRSTSHLAGFQIFQFEVGLLDPTHFPSDRYIRLLQVLRLALWSVLLVRQGTRSPIMM